MGGRAGRSRKDPSERRPGTYRTASREARCLPAEAGRNERVTSLCIGFGEILVLAIQGLFRGSAQQASRRSCACFATGYAVRAPCVRPPRPSLHAERQQQQQQRRRCTGSQAAAAPPAGLTAAAAAAAAAPPPPPPPLAAAPPTAPPTAPAMLHQQQQQWQLHQQQRPRCAFSVSVPWHVPSQLPMPVEHSGVLVSEPPLLCTYRLRGDGDLGLGAGHRGLQLRPRRVRGGQQRQYGCNEQQKLLL